MLPVVGKNGITSQSVADNMGQYDYEEELDRGESWLQIGQGDLYLSNNAQSDAASVESCTKLAKQKRTKSTLIPRTMVIARSSKKAGIEIQCCRDRTCFHCNITQPAKEYGSDSRYQKVCRTCHEKRAILGDTSAYCIVCKRINKRFKECEEFSLGLLPNKMSTSVHAITVGSAIPKARREGSVGNLQWRQLLVLLNWRS
ncbi:hypothetical protein RUND412_004027 [Rhizina undulata]